VSLNGFAKEIKRKIVVNNDITVDTFCYKIIKSMRGEMYHQYNLKLRKNYLDDLFNDVPLYYLNLKEKEKLQIRYDWGDSWDFNISLSKIVDGYNDLPFEVISGAGYGIIEDCGGSWALWEIFSGENLEWGKYDINDFDLDKCNKSVNGERL